MTVEEYSKDFLADLYWTQNLSVGDIARKLEVTRSVIFYKFKLYSIPLRHKGESSALAHKKHPQMHTHMKPWPKGVKQSHELAMKRADSRRGYSPTPETRALISKSHIGVKWSQTRRDKDIPIVMQNRKVRPTGIECAVKAVIEKHGLPYKYVGDGYTWIAGRCPDFLNVNGEKTVVEVFGRWWHDRSVNPKVKTKHTEQATIDHYAKYGFKTIVIWEEQATDDEFVLRALI